MGIGGTGGITIPWATSPLRLSCLSTLPGGAGSAALCTEETSLPALLLRALDEIERGAVEMEVCEVESVEGVPAVRLVDEPRLNGTSVGNGIGSCTGPGLGRIPNWAESCSEWDNGERGIVC